MSKSNGCHNSKETAIRLPVLVLTFISCTTTLEVAFGSKFATPLQAYKPILNDNAINKEPYYVACGTIARNATHLLVKNPHYPEPTYTKTICETVIERVDTSVNKLRVKFKQLELYRPNTNGQCLHDRFSVYTDLNVPVTQVICGNHTGNTITIPFPRQFASLILSVTTSDLDHDRAWLIEISQEK